MTVFKGCLKIAKSKIGISIMYISVFIGIMLGTQKADKAVSVDSFENHSVKIGIISEDNSVLSKGLCEYLSKDNEVTYEENDKTVLQEKMYYRDIEYAIWIPEDFVYKCLEGTENLKIMAIPEMMIGDYMKSQVDSYMTSAKMYYDAGLTEEEIVECINGYDKPKIEYVSSGKETGHKSFQIGMVFLPYIFMGILFYIFGGIFISFNEKTIKRRFQASSISASRRNLEMILAFALYSVVLWIVVMGVETLIYRNEFLSSSKFVYYVANSFVLLIMVMSIAYLMGSVIKDINLVPALTNVIALGMSFLCGVFVELELLSEGVQKVAMFLPVYWYEKGCLLLRTFGSITGEVRVDFIKYLGIQLLYAAAFIMIALVVSKNRRIEE